MYDQCTYTLIIINFFFIFSSLSIRMSGNSIDFHNKKSKKATSTKTKKYLM